MAAYYNEHDRFAAAWLRELIKAGLIADGEVDERSITDVSAADVRRFDQCHWFAGIGGWSLALRLAGWPDDRTVWTGSCPCQPFSAAGAQAGGADPRHLWPTWFRLIRECRPDVVFGEQVESAIGHGWLDLVCDDLESEDYAIGPVGLPGPCVGAYDIRQRLWFVAESDGRHAEHGELQRGGEHGLRAEDRRADGDARVDERPQDRMAESDHPERWSVVEPGHDGCDGANTRREEAHGESGARSEVRQLGDAGAAGLPNGERQELRRARRLVEGRAVSEPGGSFWADVEWIPCRDGKARPVEPGTFPLAHGVPARVGRLRGYGNAIKPELAAEFIGAYLDVRG